MFKREIRIALQMIQYLHASESSGKEIIPLLEIAEALDISMSYAEQIVSKIKAAKIVTSVRGLGGGYKLAKEKENDNYYYRKMTIEKFIEKISFANMDLNNPIFAESFSNIPLEDVLYIGGEILLK